jgi:hypothetical protein
MVAGVAHGTPYTRGSSMSPLEISLLAGTALFSAVLGPVAGTGGTAYCLCWCITSAFRRPCLW